MTKKEAKALLKQNVGRFYVYELLRPDGKPFYVGKGKSGQSTERIFQHEKYDKHNTFKIKTIRKIKRNGDKLGYNICEFFDVEKDAFALEVSLITKYGRRNNKTGILTNLTDGGEGCCGTICTEELRSKRSKATRNYFEEHPEARLYNSVKTKKWNAEHPTEVAEKQRKSAETTRTDKCRNAAREKSILFIKNNPSAKLRFVDWARDNPEEVKETRKKSAETHKAEEYRTRCSEQKKEWCEEHPEVREIQSVRIKQWRKDNPEKYLESLKNSIETHRTKEFKEVARKRSCEWIKNNPEKAAEIINKLRKTCRTKASRERNSAQRKEWFEKHPEKRDEVSSRIKKWQKENPEKFKKATAKSLATRAKRTVIRLRCLAVIKDLGINIKTPSGNDALSVWENFEIELANGTENTLAGGECESRHIHTSVPTLTTGEVPIF